MDIGREQILVFDYDLIEERDYWLGRLSSGVGDSAVPSDRACPSGCSTLDAVVYATVEPESHRELTRLTGDSPFLLYAVLIACLKTGLHWYTGSRLITVGSPALRDFEGRNALPIVDSID